MPELIVSLLDFLFRFVAIAAALWAIYLSWELWLRNGRSSPPLAIRQRIGSFMQQTGLQLQRAMGQQQRRGRRADVSHMPNLTTRYIPQPAAVERLEQHPETPRLQQQTSQAGVMSSQEILNRLLTLVQGDREAVSRLLQKTRKQHPGKSELWIWEKTILDLERDRQ
jgi:hypothetical protein